MILFFFETKYTSLCKITSRSYLDSYCDEILMFRQKKKVTICSRTENHNFTILSHLEDEFRSAVKRKEIEHQKLFHKTIEIGGFDEICIFFFKSFSHCFHNRDIKHRGVNTCFWRLGKDDEISRFVPTSKFYQS